MADLAALRGADAAGLTGGVRRHFVIVHVALGLRAGQRVDLLLHLEHVQGGDAQDLGFATLEQCGAVHARHDVHFGGQGADVTQATAVDAVVLGQDAAAHDLALQFLERVADFLVLLGVFHVGELAARVALTPSLISWMRSWRGSFSAMDRASSRSAWAISSMRLYRSSVYSGKSWNSLVSFAAIFLSSAWASQITLMNGLAASRPPATTSSSGLVWPSS